MTLPCYMYIDTLINYVIYRSITLRVQYINSLHCRCHYCHPQRNAIIINHVINDNNSSNDNKQCSNNKSCNYCKEMIIEVVILCWKLTAVMILMISLRVRQIIDVIMLCYWISNNLHLFLKYYTVLRYM